MNVETRSVLPFPLGAHPDVTTINGHDYNLTILKNFNFILYGNSSLSNETDCYLLLPRFPAPFLYANGSFVNATSCYIPINPISTHGILGLTFGTVFALSVLFTLINLRKHGKSYMLREKQWKAVGRRWQWYWMLFVAACGSISCFTAIDVDRDYLPNTPVILQSFFYTLLLPGLLACVWEGTRQWGSYEHRKVLYLNQHALSYDRHRERISFYLPLVFYLFNWLSFFMAIPRSWTPISHQRSVEQVLASAKPVATDVRFRLAAVFAVCAWLVILFRMTYNLRKYHLGSDRKLLSLRSKSLIHSCCVVALAVKVGYSLFSSWIWDLSPFNIESQPGWLYGLGHAPTVFILTLLESHGAFVTNEDKELMLLKAQQGRAFDAETGFITATAKPRWWNRTARDDRKCKTIGLKRLTFPRKYVPDDHQNGSRWWQTRKDNEVQRDKNKEGQNLHEHVRGSSLLIEDDATMKLQSRGISNTDVRSPPSLNSEASVESFTTTSIAALYSRPKQKIRSMLDV